MNRAARILAPQRADGSAASYSLAVWSGRLLHLTGQVGLDASGKLVEGGVAAETVQAITNLASILASAGLGLGDVVKCNVWLARETDFHLYDDAYRRFFAVNPPARSTMICGLINGACIEIDAIAYAGTQSGS